MQASIWQQRRRKAAISLVASSFLAIVLLASLGGNWGTAYGQTAGPTVTPAIISKDDPTIAKTANPSQAPAGSEVVFTITVRNPGTVPATNIVTLDNVPNEFRITSATSSKGAVTTTNQSVQVEIGTLAPGETVTIIIKTVVREGLGNDLTTFNRADLTGDSNGKKLALSASAGVLLNSTSVAGVIIPGLPHTGLGGGPLETDKLSFITIMELAGLAFLTLVMLVAIGLLLFSPRPPKTQA